MFKDKLRKGVCYKGSATFTEEFSKWITTCHGEIKLGKEDVEYKMVREQMEPYKSPCVFIYFEKEEDLVQYKLTFDEQDIFQSMTSSSIDTSVLYCPYIPLTITTTSTI